MASLEERVSYLEGAYQHLATREDVAEVNARIAKLETSIIKWMIGLMVSSIATACTLTLVIDRVIG